MNLEPSLIPTCGISFSESNSNSKLSTVNSDLFEILPTISPSKLVDSPI